MSDTDGRNRTAQDDILAALTLGLQVEADDPNIGPLTAGISTEQVAWIASWLASEGIGRLTAPDAPKTNLPTDPETLARRIEARPTFGPLGAADIAERAARVRAGGSPLHDYERDALADAFALIQEGLAAVDVDVLGTNEEAHTIDVRFDSMSRTLCDLPSGSYRVALIRDSDEPW